MNTVRKHLSAIQGGRLAAACRAPVVALVISDVTGDDPTHIASGPCAPDPTTYQDALDILKRYDVKAPEAVAEHLARGARRDSGNAQAGRAFFKRVENRVIATAQQSLQAAAKFFIAHDIHAAILGDSVTGEAREVAKVYGALAREVKQHGLPWQPPVALISGGETHGHRARRRARRAPAEFLLSLAMDLNGADGIHALACDTDGIDGSEDNAGAILAPDSLQRARKKKLDAATRPRRCSPRPRGTRRIRTMSVLPKNVSHHDACPLGSAAVRDSLAQTPFPFMKPGSERSAFMAERPFSSAARDIPESAALTVRMAFPKKRWKAARSAALSQGLGTTAILAP